MKDIKEVIHFYLGCDFCYRVIDVEKEQSKPMKLTADQLCIFYQLADDPNCEYKLILRKLSSMTEEERTQYLKIEFPYFAEPSSDPFKNLIGIIFCNKCNPLQFAYLLSKHFDLFGLLESGLAIDKDTLKD